MTQETLFNIATHFAIEGSPISVNPLGKGLINDTYLVATDAGEKYVLQRINTAVFRDPELMQRNFKLITDHIRRCLMRRGESDIDRKVLRGLDTADGQCCLHADGNSWRMTRYIAGYSPSRQLTPRLARQTGEAFGRFHAFFASPDAPTLKETIADFHNMPFRIRLLRDAADANPANRLAEVKQVVDELLCRAQEMTLAERLHQEGKLPKRISHCDTKADNILFDEDENVLCVIDLDTTMPGFVMADFGDFMRTAGNCGAEDDPCLDNVKVNMEVFRNFAKGYIREASFLTPLERRLLPHGAQRMAYMQAVRFLTDYLNGDTYYKTNYPQHNLTRTRAQMKLLQSLDEHLQEMNDFISSLSI